MYVCIYIYISCYMCIYIVYSSVVAGAAAERHGARKCPRLESTAGNGARFLSKLGREVLRSRVQVYYP